MATPLRSRPLWLMNAPCSAAQAPERLDQLGAIWKDRPRQIQGEAKVIKAKDDRKAALTPAIPDDEIPY